MAKSGFTLNGRELLDCQFDALSDGDRQKAAEETAALIMRKDRPAQGTVVRMSPWAGVKLEGRELREHELEALTDAQRFCVAEETALMLEGLGLSVQDAFKLATELSFPDGKPIELRLTDEDLANLERKAKKAGGEAHWVKWKKDLGL